MKTPSADEIAELNRRMADRGHGVDVRAAGALTVEDVAEASGVSADEVRMALEQIRAERAFGGTRVAAPAAKKSQWPMAALAGVLFVGAGAIYMFTPHPLTEAEIDAKQRELAEKRKHQPKKIHYPIETVMPGTSLAGIQIAFRGTWSNTSSGPGATPPILEKEAAKKYLIETTQKVFAKALEMEKGANPPPGTKPPSNGPLGYQYQPGGMGFAFGNSYGSIQIEDVPNPNTYGQRKVSLPEAQQYTIKQMVETGVDSLYEQQTRALSTSGDAARYPSPPPGFAVELQGRRRGYTTPTALYFLPIDRAAVKKKMAFYLHYALENDAKVIDVPSAEMRRRDAALPMPAFTKVVITGPTGTIEGEIPTGISDKFPSAADAGRAAEPAIQKLAEEVAQQIDHIKPGDRMTSRGKYG